VFAKMFETGRSAAEIVEAEGFRTWATWRRIRGTAAAVESQAINIDGSRRMPPRSLKAVVIQTPTAIPCWRRACRGPQLGRVEAG